MPRLVRRKPVLDRIKDYLNPGDFLLWLSEEFETRDWDSKQFGTPLALALHVVMLIARANTGRARSNRDDVFGDGSSGSGWWSYIAGLFVYLLTCISVFNALFTIIRTKKYRLFESPIDTPQNTPSAHRVRVDSSPASSSPLRILTGIFGDTSAESRAHPDPTQDVWELDVWDPMPVCLRLSCFFSPGHLLVYWLFLPTTSSDPRPSVTVFKTIVLEILMSAQLLALQSRFTQQQKDLTIIHKEVMSEYDIKFVHPRLNPLVRNVGTQYSGPASKGWVAEQDDVDVYTPTVILKRGFRTHPNPNYAKHIDPDNVSGISQRIFSPAPSYTPAYNSREPTPFTGMTPRTAIRQPQFRQISTGVISTGTSTGDGGSLGVYSHANSPLKKATSMNDIPGGRRDAPRNSFDMAGREIQEERERSRSPAKRQTEVHRSHLPKNRLSFLEIEDGRRTSAPSGSGRRSKPNTFDSPYKRDHSRW